MNNVLETESTAVIPIETPDAVLKVKLGWDAKKGTIKEHVRGMIEEVTMGSSGKAYDLDLSAILEYEGEKKPELIFHSAKHSTDSSKSISLSKDNRTGKGDGSDEEITIQTAKLPKDTKRVILFMNINNANEWKQNLYEVENVFVQIENEKTCNVYCREEEAFKNDAAKESCCYTFAELCRTENGWAIKRTARYSREDTGQDTLKALTGHTIGIE